MRRTPGLTALTAAALVATGITACASSRQVIVGTDSSGAGSSGAAQPAGAGVSTASLQSELSRLVTAQKAYFEANDYYAADLGSIDFKPATGVRMDVIQGDSDGFSAVASSGGAECAVFVGGVRSPRSYATSPDVPACRS